ncbi:MAG: radical SAM protein [Halanaerobiales bacterium]
MENEKIKTILIDGYLDEPSALGVPPYISPHIRYTYGALIEAGIKRENLDYKTIDKLRNNWEDNLNKLEDYDLIVLIAGTTVPGHYLGGRPISISEIKELSKKVYYPSKVLGGPITLVRDDFNNFDHISKEIAALDIYQRLTKKFTNLDENKITSLISNWAITGAEITKKHPNYPNLMIELETFRGCPRASGHCAFCSERLKNRTYQRKPEDIIKEVEKLASLGNHHYRLGCQTDMLLYQHNNLKPNPKAIKKLYKGIRKADPDLEVLHLDNMNPASIVKYEKESREILKIITKYNTSGDIAAFGLESADPEVIEKNNIASTPEIAFKAIKIMNEIGGKRENGVPKLLPGLNFLHALIGEREETMEYNYKFLKKVYDAGLMLRRINIRQVVTLGSYPEIKIDKKKFEDYKEKINEEINNAMLQRVYPKGTILKDLLIEKQKGKLSYGRQLGTYPILVGIPGKLPLNEKVDVKVIDHGYRSITALKWPINFEYLTPDQLSFIPGIGKKRAEQIFMEKAKSLAELEEIMKNKIEIDKSKFQWLF